MPAGTTVTPPHTARLGAPVPVVAVVLREDLRVATWWLVAHRRQAVAPPRVAQAAPVDIV